VPQNADSQLGEGDLAEKRDEWPTPLDGAVAVCVRLYRSTVGSDPALNYPVEGHLSTYGSTLTRVEIGFQRFMRVRTHRRPSTRYLVVAAYGSPTTTR
jgi:hypothetical protein